MKQSDIINVISKCQTEFEKNLRNKKIMFIYENKNRTLDKYEVYFPKNTFYHLTGIKAFDKYNKLLNSYNFYEILQKNRINEMKIKVKDSTTYYKLEVLPQLMRIDKMANMVGNFASYGLVLQTDKLIGNVNACMGFIKDSDLNMYIPNTALKEDIRNITDERKRIVAILKKDINENLYKNITYLKNNYCIEDILKNQEINKNIDISNIYSADKKIDEKIYNFFYKENNIDVVEDIQFEDDEDLDM